MAVTSTMLPLGTEVPDFTLTDVTTGETVSRTGAVGEKGLLVIFLCRHCPYVIHTQDEIARIGRDYADSGLAIIGIGANDPISHPEDAPESLAEQAAEVGFTFPYLFDETQEVAKAFTPACTPDPFLFDADGRLAYRGHLDDARPGNDAPVTGEHLREAIDALLAGESVPEEQRPSSGCGIKWRPGNEPA